MPGGKVVHFEGAKDAERLVRGVLPSGKMLNYEGAMDAERVVRAEQPEHARERATEHCRVLGVRVCHCDERGRLKLPTDQVPLISSQVTEMCGYAKSPASLSARRRQVEDWFFAAKQRRPPLAAALASSILPNPTLTAFSLSCLLYTSDAADE